MFILINCLVNAQAIKKSGYQISGSNRPMEAHSKLRIKQLNEKEYIFQKNWNKTADFKSGIGEIVKIFPVKLINTKTKEETNGFQLEGNIFIERNRLHSSDLISMIVDKYLTYSGSALIDEDESQEIISFLEKIVIPNLNNTFDNISTEYVLKLSEVIFRYKINEFDRRFSIEFINHNSELYSIEDENLLIFWTESKVDKIQKFVQLLKRI